jgi:hypothetical protein
MLNILEQVYCTIIAFETKRVPASHFNELLDKKTAGEIYKLLERIRKKGAGEGLIA